MSSSDDTSAGPSTSKPTVGSTRNPPLSAPRAIFVQREMHAEIVRDPFISPPGSARLAYSAGVSPEHTPPQTPSVIPRDDSVGSGLNGLVLPHVPSHSQLRHHYASADISSRASGIVSLRGSMVDLIPGNVKTSTRRPGTSGSEVEETARPTLSRVQSGIREAFAAPPTRPLTFYTGGISNDSSTAASLRSGPGAAPAHPLAAALPTMSKRMKSTMLTEEIDKPWTKQRDTYGKLSYYVTYGVMFLGIVGSVLRCYFGWRSVPMIKQPLCMVLDDDFDTLDTDNIWTREVDMSGFGNGEFEMTTPYPNNSYVQDGFLYLMPTLTSDAIGTANVLNGWTYNVTGCTNTNNTGCGAVSNSTAGTVINPVMSARLSTRNSRSIRFGRVEIRAKNPKGDWLWPALWMLPKNSVYGAWPMSGEIDLMESRGNGPSYSKQGSNFVRGSLNWGPTTWINEVWRTFGFWSERRSSYADGFHTYVLEWTPDFLRIYVDNRLHHLLNLKFDEPFFKRGKFPAVITNGTQQIVLQNPWDNGQQSVPNAAPFDQDFYLILDLAVGGTNGWFPDGAGNKPWLDGSNTAMRDFAEKQDEWFATWPQGDNINDRALVVDYVKMWELC